MSTKKLFITLCIALSLNLLFIAEEADAQWATIDAPSGVGAAAGTVAAGSGATTAATTTTGAAAGTAGTGGIFTTLGNDISTYVKENWEAITLAGSKMAALLLVQKITQAIIGAGDAEGGVITDWKKYLYTSTQQSAMVEMNSFFNTVSKGRLSSLNYEGVGPMNYDSYLAVEAKRAIAGRSFSTNLPEIASNPTQLFAGGNMKGIMTYMQCANNVACFTLTAQGKYAAELEKATKLATAEQSNGFLPVKKNGKITQPASIVSSALTQIDDLGTKVIMNANLDDGITAGEIQIAKGAVMNIAARTLNYATASAEGKAAIRNKNDEFPFSASYSISGGAGFSAGGVNVNTGLAAANGNLQIGNVCATGNTSIDALGNTYVSINGQKQTCPTATSCRQRCKANGGNDSECNAECPDPNNVGVTPPSITATPPSITCSTDANCNIVPGGTTFICFNQRCMAK